MANKAWQQKLETLFARLTMGGQSSCFPVYSCSTLCPLFLPLKGGGGNRENRESGKGELMWE